MEQEEDEVKKQRRRSVSPVDHAPNTNTITAMRSTPRRSDRILKKLADSIKEPKGIKGDIIKTPRGSHIQSLYPNIFDKSGKRKDLENFKRRLQFKSGTKSSLENTETYKQFHRQEKLRHFREDQRGKRDAALFKSRGLSLPAMSKTRKTGLSKPSKEGEAPSVTFVPRHNLRPRRNQLPSLDDSALTLGNEHVKRGSIEKRMSQYKRRKSESLNFVSWHDRDEEWRKKRVETYMSNSKTAREAALLKKRKLTICGWGNAQKNLGNYLSICWDYNPDLDADKTQKLPSMNSVILNRHNDRGYCTESGLIYTPEVINKTKGLDGYCFTVQSELALQYEQAQKVLFDQASILVQQSFYQYAMDLSLDTALDDGFTVDMFVSSAPDTEVGKITVRAVTQFVFMKSYIYVDKICVAAEHQKTGLGSFMMDRIISWAKKRDKDILLYALGPVVKVYEKWGFKYCKEWPAVPDDIGAIMRKRVKTADVVDDYVGLQWDGTKFV
ncbi:hypothetical protein BGZ94_009486 [Podila epigama]|nr:hypothetical protein BGZ94_009486 [Podila epigama]